MLVMLEVYQIACWRVEGQGAHNRWYIFNVSCICYGLRDSIWWHTPLKKMYPLITTTVAFWDLFMGPDIWTDVVDI